MIHSANSASDCYDVGIVGAGPSGATCAYYLAGSGHRVLLLDRARFPRDKICGDAIVPRAQIHLRQMGILPRLLNDGLANPALSGGFISPNGTQVIGASNDLIGQYPVLAIKRFVLDYEIVKSAQAAGAELVDNCEVNHTEFDMQRGIWQIACDGGRNFTAKVLVAADGANSQVARSLGLVTSRPTAVCSRAYIAEDTHDCDLDGICFYRRQLLPGYSSLFRQAHNGLGFCCYILPGGASHPRKLRSLHESLLRDDPDIRRLLGTRPEIERMRSAPLRLGGIPQSYGHQMLIIGDAAGHIDPLTGEGIQYGMDAGQLAADTLAEGLATNDLSSRLLSKYHQRCRRSFVNDFRWSAMCAQMMSRYPFLLDVSAAAICGSGQQLLETWATIMTGTQPKARLLHPKTLWPLATGTARYWWTKKRPATA